MPQPTPPSPAAVLAMMLAAGGASFFMAAAALALNGIDSESAAIAGGVAAVVGSGLGWSLMRGRVVVPRRTVVLVGFASSVPATLWAVSQVMASSPRGPRDEANEPDAVVEEPAPEDARALLLQALALSREGRTADADEAIGRALDREPDNFMALLRRCQLRSSIGEASRALPSCARAVELRRAPLALASYGLARTRSASDQAGRREGLALVEEALAGEPDAQWAWSAMAEVRALMGDDAATHEALTHLRWASEAEQREERAYLAGLLAAAHDVEGDAVFDEGPSVAP